MYHKLQQADPPSIVRHNPKRKEVSKLQHPQPCTGEAIPLHERLGRPQTEEERERDLQLEQEQIKERDVQENVDHMKAAVIGIDDEPSDEEFAERVLKEQDLRKRLYGEGTLECARCHKPFET